MKPKTIIVGLLIVLGIVVLACSGITYGTRGKPVEIGPLHVETTENHSIPPVVGVAALVGGIGVFALDATKARCQRPRTRHAMTWHQLEESMPLKGGPVALRHNASAIISLPMEIQHALRTDLYLHLPISHLTDIFKRVFSSLVFVL
jgi:hypothetical protein